MNGAAPTGILGHVLDATGNTPLARLQPHGLDHIELYAKLEHTNPTGSVKDRAAKYILEHLLASGEIDRDTLVVESSSGNFGIALAAACKRYGLRFQCVIDPRINRMNELLMRSLGAEVVRVTELDPTGGYLQTRLDRVRRIVAEEPKAYWVNQYANPLNARAYYETLGSELCRQLERIDFVLVGVSSGGTITGVSQRVKEHFPRAHVVAVDTVGSIIFGGPPRARWIPGIGASVVPAILKHAKIDDVVAIDEAAAVRACHELWREHSLFVGGSSGTAFAAVRAFFTGKSFDRPPVVVTLFADRGERYVDTVFNTEWCEKLYDGTLRRSVPVPPMPPGDEDT